MTSAYPLTAELVETKEAVSYRLKAMGASRWIREKSTDIPYKHVYWNGRDRIWISVTWVRKGYRIETWSSCPC